MLTGVFSDVHDNLEKLKKALAIYEERGISTLIFCGDFCSPIPARVMAFGCCNLPMRSLLLIQI